MHTLSLKVGPAEAEWWEHEPLRWEMSEDIGQGKRAERKSYSFDLTPLIQGYSQDFLLALKECWIDRRHQVSLPTISSQAYVIQRILQVCHEHFVEVCIERAEAPPVFDRIDADLLMGLWALPGSVPVDYLAIFKGFYNQHRHNNALFQAGLHSSDFPTGKQTDGANGHGSLGYRRQRVLARALSRAVLVHILNLTEAAYDAGELSLDVFAFSRLLLSRAARPESFRVLRLKDLQIDEANGATTYFLTIAIPKAKTAERPHATVRLHPDVGRILDRQRAAVAKRLGGLIDEKNAALSETELAYTIGDLPLFPAGGVSGRISRKTKDRLGMFEKAGHLGKYYMGPLKRITGAKLNHGILRHTIGTQLAIAGCSASTIAAVLLHATNQTAAVYVDLAFSGAIDELSDSLEPAFLEHFPVIKDFASINDKIDPTRRVTSPTADRSRRETTGECGRRQICQYAPLACYECPRFKPCYDADHTVNLDRVTEEISSARGGGLPRQADLKRYTHIANRIRVVINICEAKREAMAAEREAAGKSR